MGSSGGGLFGTVIAAIILVSIVYVALAKTSSVTSIAGNAASNYANLEKTFAGK